MKKIIFILMVCSLFIGCATNYKLSPKAESNLQNYNEISYSNGYELISLGDATDETAVAIYGLVLNNELRFGITHVNYTSKRHNIIPSQIKVTGYNSQNAPKALKVFSADEYLKKIKKQANSAIMSQALLNVGNTIQAGKSTSTTSTNSTANIYGSDGTSYTGYGSSTSTTTTTDKGAQAAENARGEQRLDNVVHQHSQRWNEANSFLLKSHTLNAGEILADKLVVVKFNKKYQTKFIIEIPFAGTVHKISFTPIN